jgi:hypothetical protein
MERKKEEKWEEKRRAVRREQKERQRRMRLEAVRRGTNGETWQSGTVDPNDITQKMDHGRSGVLSELKFGPPPPMEI